jgi:TldD protein
VRVVSGDTTAYAYTNKITADELLKAADIASRAAQVSPRGVSIDLTVVEPAASFDIGIMPDTVAIDDKVAVVAAADTAARDTDERIKQVMVVYGDVIQDVTIANSLGRLVEDRRVRTRLSVNAVAAGDGQIQTGFESIGGTQGFELTSRYACENAAREAARRALSSLEAKPAPPAG